MGSTGTIDNHSRSFGRFPLTCKSQVSYSRSYESPLAKQTSQVNSTIYIYIYRERERERERESISKSKITI